MTSARELLGTELAALVSESYERAYIDVVRAQQLAELEEVIHYSQALRAADGAFLSMLVLFVRLFLNQFLGSSFLLKHPSFFGGFQVRLLILMYKKCQVWNDLDGSI